MDLVQTYRTCREFTVTLQSVGDPNLAAVTKIILVMLEDGAGENPTAIATHLGVKKAVVSHSVKDLTKHELVKVKRENTDRRQRKVYVTKKGRKCAREILAAYERVAYTPPPF